MVCPHSSKSLGVAYVGRGLYHVYPACVVVKPLWQIIILNPPPPQQKTTCDAWKRLMVKNTYRWIPPQSLDWFCWENLHRKNQTKMVVSGFQIFPTKPSHWPSWPRQDPQLPRPSLLGHGDMGYPLLQKDVEKPWDFSHWEHDLQMGLTHIISHLC